MYLRPVVVLFLQLSVLLGLVYPLVVTGLSQLLFPYQANGSLIYQDQKVIGSQLVGQGFLRQDYFWPRPSATAEFAYNPMASGGSNWAPTNPKLLVQAQTQLHALSAQGGEVVPVQMLTHSGSGLDPHIGLQAALYQVERVAQARGRPAQDIRALVLAHTDDNLSTGFQPLVNVLNLNLALQQLPVSHGL